MIAIQYVIVIIVAIITTILVDFIMNGKPQSKAEKRFYVRKINYQKDRFIIMFFIFLLVSITGGACIFGARFSVTADTEIINGAVTGKHYDRVSCSHSYQCNCRTVTTGSGKNATTSTECDTCYEHHYDVNWVIDTTVGDIGVDRIDRQGINTPPRWEQALAGQPVAKTHIFTNYIKGAESTLFKHTTVLEKFDDKLPTYPDSIYDLHYINRVLTSGVNMPNATDYNDKLATILKELGPQKQANIILVFTVVTDKQYVEALKNKWLGGKKNDVIVVISTPDGKNINWAEVVSWTDKQLFKVTLRDDIQALPTLSPDTLIPVIEKDVYRMFDRKHMKDFEYLVEDIDTPWWCWLIFAVIVAGVLSAAYKNKF